MRSTVVLFTICAALGAAAYFSGVGVSQETSPPRTIPQPTRAQLRAAGLAKAPARSESKRVDLEAPTFSDPTTITNPLFPISRPALRGLQRPGRRQAIPHRDHAAARDAMIEWSPGQTVRARVSQYFAYVAGRVEEVALDYYAQADDGSVWYLGEEVNDYDRNGFVDSTLGSWLAGRRATRDDHARPPQGRRRPQGREHPRDRLRGGRDQDRRQDRERSLAGRVRGAMVARELHDDGTYSDKVFAPGYGEFFTGDKGELEALALAVPTDALRVRSRRS